MMNTIRGDHSLITMMAQEMTLMGILFLTMRLKFPQSQLRQILTVSDL